MTICKKNKKYAKDFIARNDKNVASPIAFYYHDKNKFIVIDNNSFSCKELEFATEKEAEEYCNNANKI